MKMNNSDSFQMRQQWYQLVEIKRFDWSILAYFEFKSSRRKPGRRIAMIDFQNYLDYEPTHFHHVVYHSYSVWPTTWY